MSILTGPARFLKRLAKAIVRTVREVSKPLRIWTLERLNERSHESILGSVPVIVSLTTHGSRVETAHIAIESIGAGKSKPARLILWLDDVQRFSAPSPHLKRLIDRGLEIRLTDNLGPHTKYFPALALAMRDGLELVTADDDILYPKRWLERLWRAARATPGSVIAYKAHRIRLRQDGTLHPYKDWDQAWDPRPSTRNFALGVSGVWYPPRMLRALSGRGKDFMSCTPRNDDVWLHFVALEEDIAVRQLGCLPTHFAQLPVADAERLSALNVDHRQNDQQIARTHTPAALYKLTREPENDA